MRIDFSNQSTWEKICAAIRKAVGLFRFRAHVEFHEDRQFEGLKVEQLLESVPNNYPHSFIFLVDSLTMNQPEYPVLVIDLFDQPGRSFRVIPREIQGIENNLSIANMDFEEFSSSVDRDGVFRGFRRK